MPVAPVHRTCLARALCACLGAALLLAGCHGSSIPPPGTPVVTLADGNGSFSSYTVAIDSITLTASNGGLASLLSNVQSVDLARQTQFAELVSALPAAAGTYVSAQVTLDFSTAQIWYNNNGTAVPCAPRDPAGASPGLVTVTVTFDPEHPLQITQNVSTRLAVEVDLAASNTVNAAVSPCTVTVQPYLTVRPTTVDSTVMRARGLLVIAQQAQNNFIMNTRPLYDLVSIGMGAVTVDIGPKTYWNINGTVYRGAAGLPILGQQGLNTPIAAYGTLGNLASITPTFTASSVYVGTSLESPLEDHVTGVVAARSGDKLTLHSSLYVSRIGVATFEDSSTATLGAKTLVSEDGGAAGGLTPASVSVGQVLDISGQAAIDSNGNLALDATLGKVRLASTRVWGTVNSATTGSMSINAQTFADYAASGFGFDGTGSNGGIVDPAAYAVTTGALNVAGLPAGALVAVDGIVAPFGAAPPDFSATAVTPGGSTPQRLVVEWPDGSATPFTTLRPDEFIVDLSNPQLSAIHYIETGPQKLDLKSLPASPVITTTGAPNPNDLSLSIGSTALTTGISMFTNSTKFATAAAGKLNGTYKLYRLVAVGQFNSTTNTFVASSISLALHE